MQNRYLQRDIFNKESHVYFIDFFIHIYKQVILCYHCIVTRYNFHFDIINPYQYIQSLQFPSNVTVFVNYESLERM